MHSEVSQHFIEETRLSFLRCLSSVVENQVTVIAYLFLFLYSTELHICIYTHTYIHAISVTTVLCYVLLLSLGESWSGLLLMLSPLWF